MLISSTRVLKDPRYHTKRWQSIARLSYAPQRFTIALAPLMEYVCSTLEISIAKQYSSLENVLAKGLIFRSVKRDLTNKFSSMISRVCVLELHAVKEKGFLKGLTSKARFDYFVKELAKSEHIIELLNKYKILKKLIDIYLSQYIETRLEFFKRLHEDSTEIYKCLLHNDAAFQLTLINSSGDTHRSGRCVSVLLFKKESKIKKVVYKPRSLAVDEAFQELIVWFNKQPKHIKLFEQHILPRKDYGWCEFVEHKSCQTVQQVKQFYQREGALLAVMYLLAGSDIHSENLIAHGAHPVIVDLECLLRPFFLTKDSDDKTLARQFVLDTLFLPHRTMADDEYSGFDISAIAGEGGEETPYSAINWEHSGTDDMKAIRKKRRMPTHKNLPRLKKKSVDPLLYEKDFIFGFQSYYRLIQKKLSIFKSKHSPFNIFKRVPIRLVLRNTSEYAKLLAESYHPLLLYNKKERDKHFDWLKQCLKDEPVYRYIIRSELNDIYAVNIPFFYSYGNSRFIYNAKGEKLHVPVIKTGLQRIKEHVAGHINSSDLFVQTQLIINSFETLRLNRSKKHWLIPHWSIHRAQAASKSLLSDALSLAEKQLDTLSELIIVNRSRVFWPTIQPVREKTWNSEFTDIYLYNGIAGIGLTFVYAGEIFKKKLYRDIAHLCFKSLHETLRENPIGFFKNVGAFSGVGGLIYAFSCYYHVHPSEQIKKDLYKLFGYIPTLLKEDKALDIISGAAGCLASVYAARGIVNHVLIDETAKACVRHILRLYPKPWQFPKVDSPLDFFKPLLGFSHGVAGIAWALSKYYADYPVRQVRNWIKAALRYERRNFSQVAKNWPDFRKGSHTRAMAWCHGAPGIGLARSDMISTWDDKRLIEEVSVALYTVIKKGFGGNQCLCHGDLGNLELLLETGHEKYETYAAKIIQRMRKKGVHCDPYASFAMPGLMTGNAGVAYQLMRIAKPHIVPSVLLLKYFSS